MCIKPFVDFSDHMDTTPLCGSVIYTKNLIDSRFIVTQCPYSCNGKTIMTDEEINEAASGYLVV